ncbi:MAG: metallophosphoesterase [Polyangiaceae bacterium]|nr:metallophosphoesterase [Polyangiaceae bacterium]
MRARAIALILLALSAACTAAGVGLRASRNTKATGSIAPPAPTTPAMPDASAAAPAPPNEIVVAERAPDRSRTRTIGTCDESARPEVARVTIAHFNDLQARYSDRVAGKSRYALLAGYLRQLKKDNPETLVLDAGDDYEKGSIAELRSEGETTRQMIQALPIDVRTIGNHDFAYGADAVLRDVRMSRHPVLAANVQHIGLSEDEQPFLPFVRVDVGCVKVGIVGLVTKNYGADDRPTSAPFDGVFAQDDRYARVLERQVKAHGDEVDLLIALTHLGYADDNALAMSPAARGVDFVIGGHSEQLFREPLLATRPDGTRTWVLQAGHYGENVGRADLALDLKDKKVKIERYRVINVNASLPSADDVDDLAKRLEDDAAKDAHEIIATTQAEITAGASMVQLVARAAKETLHVDALVIGKDHFRRGLPKGAVTLQRMYEAVPVQKQPAGTEGFSSLWIVEMPGEELSVLRARPGAASYAFNLFIPTSIDPNARYRVALDKRALMFPRLAFGKNTTFPTATFGGELIDVLESYARAHTDAFR